MDLNKLPQASIPNPALKDFGPWIGVWETTGTHGLLPDTLLHGRESFEWLENGAFVLLRSQIDDPRFPVSIAIFASDDAVGQCFKLTFDSRGVSRMYDASLQENILKWWRNAPGFYQRYEARIAADGRTIISRGELSKDGVTWEKDLDLTYQRME